MGSSKLVNPERKYLSRHHCIGPAWFRELSAKVVRFAALMLLLTLPARAALKPGETAEAMRVLKTNCFSCHSEQKKKGGLVMSSREAIRVTFFFGKPRFHR